MADIFIAHLLGGLLQVFPALTQQEARVLTWDGLADHEPARIYALNHPKGKIMFQVYSNSATGEVSAVELDAFEQTIKAPTAMQMKKDIDANGKAILNINSDTDKSTLQPEGKKVVDEILTLMQNNADLKISIEGHTDNAGSVDHNKKQDAETSFYQSPCRRCRDGAYLNSLAYFAARRNKNPNL